MPEVDKEVAALVLEDQLATLLEAGRHKIRQEKEDQENERKKQKEEEIAIRNRRMAPLIKSARKELPTCWHPFIDWQEEEFRSSVQHTILVNLHGLAPIAAYMCLDDWADQELEIGTRWVPAGRDVPGEQFSLGKGKARYWLQAAKYVPSYDEDGREEYVVYPSFSEPYRGYDYDPGRVMVLAYDEELRKPQVQAECDRKNQQEKERHRQKEETKVEVQTVEGRLLGALREFIRQER